MRLCCCCCCFLNLHLFMLTVSVTCRYFGGFIYTYPDITFWKLRFFSPFLPCRPFTHKRRFCATKKLVLGFSPHVSEYFWKRRNSSPCLKKKRNTLHVAYFNRFCQSIKTLNIFVPLTRLWTDTYHPKTCQCIHQICNYRLGRWLQWDPFHHSYCGMLMPPNHLS